MPLTQGKETFIERVFGRLFESFAKDPRTALLVMSVMLNFYLVYNRLEYADKMNEKIVIEVEKRVDSRVPAAVKKEVKEQIEPVKKNIDTASSKLDQMIDIIKK